MFDVARLNLAGQWHTPSLGVLAELLVFYDRVDIRSPVGRLGGLLPNEIDDLRFFRELVEQGKVSIVIDQTPLGEVAWEMGLFGDPLGGEVDPAITRERLRAAYLGDRSPPLNRLLARDKPYADAWAAEWERILSLSVNPVERNPAYVDQLIANGQALPHRRARFPEFGACSLCCRVQPEDP